MYSSCPTCCADGYPGHTSERGDGVPGHTSRHSASNKTVAVLLIVIVFIVVRLALDSFGARSHFGTDVFAVAAAPAHNILLQATAMAAPPAEKAKLLAASTKYLAAPAEDTDRLQQKQKSRRQ